jgi:hypothetical protein
MPMRCPSTSFLTAALAAALSLPAWAGGPSAEHSAACVAALQVEAEAMADALRHGQTEVESELVRRVQQGFAFIGTAYLQGIRDVEANRLLKAAEDAQQLLPATELAARQAACRSEGTRLLEEANPLERAFVMKAAQRRVDILKKPHTTG